MRGRSWVSVGEIKRPKAPFGCFGSLSARGFDIVLELMSDGIELIKPRAFRLPPRGGDPFFGLPRGQWYIAEKRGEVKFVRVTPSGKSRGITLVDFESAEQYYQRLKNGSNS